MNKKQIELLQPKFDELVNHSAQGEIEFWYARELQVLLDYTEWRNFLRVINDAKEACKASGGKVENHFVDVNKMVQLGSGAERAIEDIILTRYACYLIAQNGDPRKEPVAFAQTYFALQTRKLELIEERIRLNERLQAHEKLKNSETALSKNIFERGVDGQGFGRIRSKGDAALFGGHSTQSMKNQLAVPGKRPLDDFLPTITIAAKNLATEITNHNVSENDLQGENNITKEHVQNNQSVRNMLGERGIQPEKLAPAEDLNYEVIRIQAHITNSHR